MEVSRSSFFSLTNDQARKTLIHAFKKGFFDHNISSAIRLHSNENSKITVNLNEITISNGYNSVIININNICKNDALKMFNLNVKPLKEQDLKNINSLAMAIINKTHPEKCEYSQMNGLQELLKKLQVIQKKTAPQVETVRQRDFETGQINFCRRIIGQGNPELNKMCCDLYNKVFQAVKNCDNEIYVEIHSNIYSEKATSLIKEVHEFLNTCNSY